MTEDSQFVADRTIKALSSAHPGIDKFYEQSTDWRRDFAMCGWRAEAGVAGFFDQRKAI